MRWTERMRSSTSFNNKIQTNISTGRLKRRSFLRRKTVLCAIALCATVFTIISLIFISPLFFSGTHGEEQFLTTAGVSSTVVNDNIREKKNNFNSNNNNNNNNNNSDLEISIPPKKDEKYKRIEIEEEKQKEEKINNFPPCCGFNETRSTVAQLCANGAANRAPLSSLRKHPLELLSTINNNNTIVIGTESLVCYSYNGNFVNRKPIWVRPLLKSLITEKVYEAALSLLTKDPWYILIGWVVDKFMPLQKPGRKANGDIIIPQTKGKNATFYLETYGSVWHTEFIIGGIRYHFQLVHRNAIAVCIRERIHLYKFYCVPDAKIDPIPIHICACRHCNIPTELPDERNLPSMYVRYPNLKEINLVEIPKIIHFNSSIDNNKITLEEEKENRRNEEDNCINAFEAPWLINTTIISKFPYEGKHNDLDNLLAQQADFNGIVTMVIFNSFWRDHLHNFVYGFMKKAKMRNLIVATLDDASLLICLSFRLPCYNATLFAEPEAEKNFSQIKGLTRKVTEELSWVKPRLAIAVLRRGYGFLLADLDMTWNKPPPMRDLLKTSFDILHQCDSKSELSINSGFYLARPNERVLRYFIDLMSFRTDESADQNAMRLFMKYDHMHGVSHKCLPWFDFNMKCNYKVLGSVVIKNRRETFLWKRYPVNETPRWTIMHATCLSGAKDKIRYFKTIKAWFLDELDAKTGTKLSPKPFCVIIPSLGNNNSNGKNTIVNGIYGITPHSELYEEMVPDPKYLQERH